MKKYWKYIAMFAVAAAMMPLTACDDEVVDPYDINYIYFYQPNETFASLEYKANGSFLVDIPDTVQLVPVRLTKPAPTNMNIEIAFDPSLVDEYNQANGTDYVYLEGAELLTPSMHIAQGEYISPDSIKVDFSNRDGFKTENENLILPIVIRQANGGVTISKSSRIFLTFSSTYHPNWVSVKENFIISNNTEEEGWETANTNYTISDFFTTEWSADAQIDVNIEIDNSLIEAYNRTNATEYKPIQVTLSQNVVSIAAGESTADLAFTLGDYTGVANGEEYLIPVKMSVDEESGAGLKDEVSYIIVTELPMEVYASTNLGAFSLIPYDASWTAINHSVNYGEEDFEYILPDNQNYYGVETGDVMEVDFGTVRNIRVLGLEFYAWYYALNNVDNIQTSVDGITWSNWGSASLGMDDTWYITFSKNAKCRYIRWSVGDYSYSSYYGCFFTNVRFYE